MIIVRCTACGQKNRVQLGRPGPRCRRCHVGLAGEVLAHRAQESGQRNASEIEVMLRSVLEMAMADTSDGAERRYADARKRPN